jgi:hypothetical protein
MNPGNAIIFQLGHINLMGKPAGISFPCAIRGSGQQQGSRQQLIGFEKLPPRGCRLSSVVELRFGHGNRGAALQQLVHQFSGDA